MEKRPRRNGPTFTGMAASFPAVAQVRGWPSTVATIPATVQRASPDARADQRGDQAGGRARADGARSARSNESRRREQQQEGRRAAMVQHRVARRIQGNGVMDKVIAGPASPMARPNGAPRRSTGWRSSQRRSAGSLPVRRARCSERRLPETSARTASRLSFATHCPFLLEPQAVNPTLVIGALLPPDASGANMTIDAPSSAHVAVK
jgi:hypothetical protein